MLHPIKEAELLIDRMNREGHEDWSKAVETIDWLMTEYAYTRDPLSDEAKKFAFMLRAWEASWRRM